MHVIYSGPHPSVDVSLPSGRSRQVKRDTPTKVPDEIGRRLCEQRHWREHKAEKAQSKSQSTSTSKTSASKAGDDKPPVKGGAANPAGAATIGDDQQTIG